MKTLLLALIVALACGCGGTNTGNPPYPANSTGAPSTAAQTVLDAACAKLTACFTSLTPAQCDSGIEAQTNLGATFGLSAGFGSFQSIIDAETSGSIHANSTAEAQCVSDLNALSCSGNAVQSAYSASAPSDFSQVFSLFPTSPSSCKGLY